MRKEFVYSLAALGGIPITVNADVDVYKATSAQIVAGEDIELELGDFGIGYYEITFDAITISDPSKTLTVQLLRSYDGGTTWSEQATTSVANGKTYKWSNRINGARKMKLVLKAVDGATVTVPAPSAKMIFDFATTASKLLTEYNKLSSALATYEYEGVQADISAYSSFYDRIQAIKNATHEWYLAETSEEEPVAGAIGLKNFVYLVKKSTVTAEQIAGTGKDIDGNDLPALTLYKEIQNALDIVADKEKAYELAQLDTDGGDGMNLAALNTRYGNLGAMYQSEALTTAKNDATAARDAYNSIAPTYANFEALKTALATAKEKLTAYANALSTQETVKTDNEEANTDLVNALDAVYGATSSYYTQTLANINENYAGERYAELKEELTSELTSIVTGPDYTDVKTAIGDAYTGQTSKAAKNTLINQIAGFKQKITQKVSDFNALKDQLAAAYSTYDEQKTAADALVKDAPADLADEKQDVQAAVVALENFIKANDTKNSIANLTQGSININTLVNDISLAKEAYVLKKAQYDKYVQVKASVTAKQTALNNAVTAADTYAKSKKKLDDTKYKPSTIWATTVTAITGQVNTLLGNVNDNDNKWDAATYEESEEFQGAMTAIQTAIDNFAANAQEATNLYATINAQIKSASDLRTALNDKSKAPKVDLTLLNVWTNQVTTVEAIKARTPYNTVINTLIAGDIEGWTNNLATAVTKKDPFNPDPEADNTGNILGYLQSVLKDLGGDASKVLSDDIATLEAIKANYQSDEEAFLAQQSAQEIAGMKNVIISKASILADQVAILQKNIDEKVYGNVKGALLQKEIDAISEKINAAKAVAEDEGATMADLTEQNNIVTGLNTDLADAQANATDYAAAFNTFVARYNSLNGTKDDPAGNDTYNGLVKFYAAQDAIIDALANLTDAQKTAYKDKVEAVEVTKKESGKNVKYTKANILSFIENAKDNEELTEAEVTKYQGIISDLKNATNTPVEQAKKLNALEGLLAAIDFEAAKAATLSSETGDPNEDGYYYKLLTGTSKKGQYQYDFNKQKSTIEEDSDIKDSEYKLSDGTGTYADAIATIKTNVEGVATKAKNNLDFKKEQEDYLAKTRDHKYSASDPDEPWYGLTEAIAELSKEEYASSVQAEQLNTLNGYKDVLDNVEKKIASNYKDGKYGTDAGAVKARADINNFLAQCTDEVNYNAQVAKDNKDIHDAMTAAYDAASATYQAVANNINAYKNLKSTEMKAAAGQAETEYNALIAYLFDFEEKISAVKNTADEKYGATVSPAHYDSDKSYQTQIEGYATELKNLEAAFLNKIQEAAGPNVEASVNNYTNAIAASKAKVVKFSATAEDLDEETMTTLFGGIDGLLEHITDAGSDLKKLDEALSAAENAETGIAAKIKTTEQTQAKSALTTVVTDAWTLRNYLSVPSRNRLSSLRYMIRINQSWIYDADGNRVDIEDTWSYRVANFSDLKTAIQELKAQAEQNKANAELTQGAVSAIDAANNALNVAYDFAYNYTAGIDVKAKLDAIKAQLANYPVSGVTVTNADEWQAFAESLYKAPEAPATEPTGAIPALANDLYDAEVVAIDGLLITAQQEYITYKAGATPADAAAAKGVIDTQKENLATIKNAVAPAEGDPTMTKYQALANDGIDLYDIETALNNVIATMQTANGTNQNADIVADLNTQKTAAQTALNNALNGYDSVNVGGDDNWAELTNDKAAIQTSIDALASYITEHADNMSAFQANASAKISDINVAIANLKQKAASMKQAYDQGVEDAAKQQLADTWTGAEGLIIDAQGDINEMNIELEAYGSSSKYANKVSKLNDQIANAQNVLTEQKAAAEAKETTAEKQAIADNAKNNLIPVALDGVEANCNDIIDLAKDAYIATAIDAMQTELAAITWNPENYTNTDQGLLSEKKNKIESAISSYATAAQNQPHALPTFDDNNEETTPGVIKSLAENKKLFDTSVAELKQMIKDYSLEDDKRGHITGGDDITTDDIMALSDIIANSQEGDADLERCDVNGDGHISVTDIIWLQYFWAFNEWPDAPAAARGEGGHINNSVSLETMATGDVTRIAINLNNDTAFRAFQIGLQLPAGAKVVGQSFGSRVTNGYLMQSENKEGFVRFMTISANNRPFEGNSGAVLYVDVENMQGSVQLIESFFTDTAYREANLLNGNESTGIVETISNAIETAGQKIYDFGGRVLRGLKKGVNIIRNSDGTTTKVIKK